MTCMKKLLAVLLLLCMTMTMLPVGLAEGADKEDLDTILASLADEVNAELGLNAEHCYWLKIKGTNDPTIKMAAVGTYDNSKSIVLIKGDRLQDEQLKLLAVKGSTAPAALTEVHSYGDDYIYCVYDKNLTDGKSVINAKDAWFWFADADTLISGDYYPGSSRTWIGLDCKHIFNQKTGELRKKNIHNFDLVGGQPSSCTKHGWAEYECTRCHDRYTRIRPLSHKPVTIGLEIYCKKCGRRLR